MCSKRCDSIMPYQLAMLIQKQQRQKQQTQQQKEQRQRCITTVTSYCGDIIAGLHSNFRMIGIFRWRGGMGGKRLLKLLLTIISCSLLIGCQRSVYAAPQSCVLCDKSDIEAKDPRTNYEEFLFEHQVTRQDAINALKLMNNSFYDGPSPENSCKSITCSKKVMKYCLGPQFINDHCWCELGHNDEGLPFVPHICYVGEKVHTASVGSCFFYEEVKDCCCVSALAKQWRHISGSESIHNNIPDFFASVAVMLICLLVVQ